MLRKAFIAIGLVGLVAAGASVSAPLSIGLAMLVPALLLATVLWIGWYPGAERLDRLAQRVRRKRRCRRAGISWSIPRWRRSSFAVPAGHLLGLQLAVRPPPA